MKKAISGIITIVLCLSLMAGCGGNAGSTAAGSSQPAEAASSSQSTAGSESEPASEAPESESAAQANATVSADGQSVVYITTDISSDGLMAVYEALGWTPTGNVAIKVTTGEPPNSNYLRAELIGDLARSIDGTFVESNTAYGGQRASDAMHLQVAKDHGFADMTPKGFDLMDEGGQEISLPVIGGEVLTENFVGAHLANYDSMVVLSHFKGHAIAGMGGAIKNISIGIASPGGKIWIHTGGETKTEFGAAFRPDVRDPFQKSMAEAGKSVSDSLDGKMVYINVMNRLSIDCDCDGNPSEPDMHDVGILASYDPVALDKACYDLVAADPDGASLLERMNTQNAALALEHGEAIGLGSRTYELVSIDD